MGHLLKKEFKPCDQSEEYGLWCQLVPLKILAFVECCKIPECT